MFGYKYDYKEFRKGAQLEQYLNDEKIRHECIVSVFSSGTGISLLYIIRDECVEEIDENGIHWTNGIPSTAEDAEKLAKIQGLE